MSTLELLIARGRRVRRPREQREVAFALSDLTTHEELHLRMVQKGALRTLVQLLEKAVDPDAARFAALALGNLACTPESRVILADEGAVRPLLQHVRKGDVDIVGRQYAALALGNLALTESVLEEMWRLDAVGALVELLQVDDLQAGRYAAFALGNLAASEKFRLDCVKEGCIGPLVALASCDNIAVQRQALATLRCLAQSASVRALIVQEGALDPLVLMSVEPDVLVRREVAAALFTLSSAQENKMEIALRALAQIIDAALCGDAEVEKRACGTLANLVELPELHDKLIEAGGLPPVVSLLHASDLQTRAEACRALSSLAANSRLQVAIVKAEALPPLVAAMQVDSVMCQRFAALALANLATHLELQESILQAGAVALLVAQATDGEREDASRRFAILALSNFTAVARNHAQLLKGGTLQALFSLSNSYDVVSQYYAAYAIANLASNGDNHAAIVRAGGLQPLISLVYSEDPDVKRQAVAALRGLAVDHSVRLKIVQEGGLEPMLILSATSDIEIQREVSAALVNLALSDENKYEIVRSGAVPPLLHMAESEDMEVSQQACAALASVAELRENQLLIADEGGIAVLVEVYRSPFVEVQREAGRALANLAATEDNQELIIEAGGHLLLISHLLSPDTACQRVGALGIGNLATNPSHRQLLMAAAVLEPLMSLARSAEVQLEVQRFAVLAIANLATSPENHRAIVSEGALPLLISLSDSPDEEIRQYAAFALVKMARNASVRKKMTEEGGLEPVLFLARTDDRDIHRSVLPALCTLSYADANKVEICRLGGLAPVISFLFDADEDAARQACTTLANLAELISNQRRMVAMGCLSNLVRALDHPSEWVCREAARALGNLAMNVTYGEQMVELAAVPRLARLLDSSSIASQRMAAMALGNIATHVASQAAILAAGVLPPLVELLHLGLDGDGQLIPHPDGGAAVDDGDDDAAAYDSDESDDELARAHRDALEVEAAIAGDRGRGASYLQPATADRLLAAEMEEEFLAMPDGEAVAARAAARAAARRGDLNVQRYVMLALANLAVSHGNHGSLLGKPLMAAMPYSLSLNQRMRFYTLYFLSNLASSLVTAGALVSAGAVPLLVRAAFPGDADVQYQAITALGSLALHSEHRLLLVREGVLEPLLLAASSDDYEVMAAVAIALANMSIAADVKIAMGRSGCLPALLSLARTGIPSVEVPAVTALGNLAEATEGRTQLTMREEGTLAVVVPLLHAPTTETRRQITRVLACLAVRAENHADMLAAGAFNTLVLAARDDDAFVTRHACLGVGHLAQQAGNHERLMNEGALDALCRLVARERLPAETQLAAAYALNNLTTQAKLYDHILRSGVPAALQKLAMLVPEETHLQALTALRQLAAFPPLRRPIADGGALQAVLSWHKMNDVFVRKQAAALLRNLLLSESLKQQLLRADGALAALVELAHAEESEVALQAVRALGNMAEAAENQVGMVEWGVVHHLKYILRSPSVAVRREATRCLANLAADFACTSAIASGGGLEPLLAQLRSEDAVTQRFAAMGLGNLASNARNQGRIVAGGGVAMLVALVGDDAADDESQLYSMQALCNLSAAVEAHEPLLQAGFLRCLTRTLQPVSDERARVAAAAAGEGGSDAVIRSHYQQLRDAAAFALANLASSPAMHAALVEAGMLPRLVALLDDASARTQRRATAAIRGLGVDRDLRDQLVDAGALAPLLSLARSPDTALQAEVLAALCNLSLTGCIGRNPVLFLEAVDVAGLVSFLTSADATYRLFGALTLGNVAAAPEHHDSLLSSGALAPLLAIGGKADTESIRAIAYALVNLASNPSQRTFIAQRGGLIPLLALARSEHITDQRVAFGALRGLSASPRVRHKMVKDGILAALLRGAASDDSTVARESAYTLYHLSLPASLKMKLAQDDVLPVLIQLLYAPPLAVLQPALSALACLTEDTDTHARLLDAGLLTAAASLIRTIAATGEVGGRADSDAGAAVADAEMEDEEERKAAASEGTDSRLDTAAAAAAASERAAAARRAKELLAEELHSASESDEGRRVQRDVLRILANLACNFSVHGLLLAQVGMDTILRSTSSTDATSRRFALQLLVNFGRNDTSIDALASAAVSRLLQLAGHDEDASCRLLALRALAAIARLPSWHAQLVTDGVLRPAWAALSPEEAAAAGLTPLLPPVPDADPLLTSAAALLPPSAALLLSPKSGGEESGEGWEAASEASGALASSIGDRVSRSSDGAKRRAAKMEADTRAAAELEARMLAALLILRLASSPSMHEQMREAQVLPGIVSLASCSTAGGRLLAISAMRRISLHSSSCRSSLIAVGSSDILAAAARGARSEDGVLREVAATAARLVLNGDSKRVVASSDLLPVLVEMAQSLDEKRATQAMTALATLAEDSGVHERMEAEQALYYAVYSMTSKHATVARQAIRLVGNMLHTAWLQKPFFDSNGLPSLVAAARRKDGMARLHTARIFFHLSAHAETRRVLLDGGAVAVLLRLLGNVEHAPAAHALVVAARNFAADEELQLKLASAGLPQVLFRLAAGADAAAASLALSALASLARHAQLRGPLVDAGCLQLLNTVCPRFVMAALEETGEAARSTAVIATDDSASSTAADKEGGKLSGDRGDGVDEAAADADGAAALAIEGSVELIELEAGGAARLQTGTPYVQLCALTATLYSNLAERPRNQPALARRGMRGLRALCALQQQDIASSVARVYAALTSHAGNGEAQFNDADYSTLFDMAINGRGQCARYAVMAIGNLSSLSSDQISAVGEAGIPPLVRMLSSTEDEDGRHFSARVLYRLASHPDNRKLIVEQDALPALHAMLEGENVEHARFAAMTLCNLARDADVQARIGRDGRAPALLAVLRLALRQSMLVLGERDDDDSDDDDDDDVESDSDALPTSGGRESSAEEKEVEATDARFVLPREVPILADSRFSVLYALMALSNVSLHDDNHDLLIKGDCLQLLLPLTVSNDAQLAQHALQVACNIAMSRRHRALMTDTPGLLASMHAGLQREQQPVRLAATRLAYNLTCSDSSHAAVHGVGAIAVLVQLMRELDEDVRHAAVLTLSQLAGNAQLRHVIVSSGGLQAAIIAAHEAALHTRRRALLLLSNLMCDAVSQHAAAMHGALVPVLEQARLALDAIEPLAKAALERAVDSVLSYDSAAAAAADDGKLEEEDAAAAVEAAAADAAVAAERERMAALRVPADMLEAAHASLLALVNLCSSEKNSALLLERGVLSVLMRYVNAGAPELRLGNDSAGAAGLDASTEEARDRLLADAMERKPDADPDDLLADVEMLLYEQRMQQMAALRKAAVEEVRPLVPRKLVRLATLALANLTSADGCLRKLQAAGAAAPLLALAEAPAQNVAACALSAVRRLTDMPQLTRGMLKAGVLPVLSRVDADKLELQLLRDAAAGLCNMAFLRSARPALLGLDGDSGGWAARGAGIASAGDTSGGVLHLLSQLARVRDVETARQATSALASLAEEATAHEALEAAGIGSFLMGLLRNPALEVQREAARAVSNLLASAEQQPRIILAGVAGLVVLGRSADSECQQAAALAFRRLAPNLASHMPLIAAGALRTMLFLVRVPDRALQLQASAALRDMSADEEVRPYLMAEDALPTLRDLALEPVEALQCLAVAAMRHMTLLHAAKLAFLADGLLPAVLRCARSKTLDLLSQCAAVLANVSELVENQLPLVEGGCVAALVYLGGIPNTEIARDVSRTLANLCSNVDLHLPLYRQGGVMRLISLTQLEDELVQRYSAMALRFVASNAATRVAIVRDGMLEAFLVLARSPVAEYQSSAASALASFSLSEENKAYMVRDGGLHQLLQFLRNPRAELQVLRDAAFALANLALSDEYHSDMAAEGALDVLVALSTHADARLQRDAARALCDLACTSTLHARMVLVGVLPALFQLGKSLDISAQRYAALALASLAAGPERRELLAAGGIAPLTFLMRFPDVEVQRSSALALAGLSLEDVEGAARAVQGGGALQPLVELSRFPDLHVLRTSSVALAAAALGEDDAAKRALKSAGAVPSLLALSVHEDLPIARSAVFALGALAEEAGVRETMARIGALPTITAQCATDDLHLKRHSTYFLALFAEESTFHARLAKAGAISCFIASASMEDAELQEVSSFALAHLASTRELQKRMVDEGALAPLVTMLSVHPEPRHYAGLALLKLAENFETHLQLAESGGIQALLRLARAPSTEEELAYKAALAVGHLASNAVKLLPRHGEVAAAARKAAKLALPAARRVGPAISSARSGRSDVSGGSGRSGSSYGSGESGRLREEGKTRRSRVRFS